MSEMRREILDRQYLVSIVLAQWFSFLSLKQVVDTFSTLFQIFDSLAL